MTIKSFIGSFQVVLHGTEYHRPGALSTLFLGLSSIWRRLGYGVGWLFQYSSTPIFQYSSTPILQHAMKTTVSNAGIAFPVIQSRVPMATGILYLSIFSLYPQLRSRQARKVPFFFVVFSTRIGAWQSGQARATGLSQVAKSHSGNRLHP